MVLEVIYIVRHGYRSNWTVDPTTGTYSTTIKSPTGIPSDPALASYGVIQSRQLARHLHGLDPPVDIIYSSPYYRCLQTLEPWTTQLAERSGEQSVTINIEPGLGEFYGAATFEHPGPADIEELNKHFPHLHAASEAVLVPDKKGEGIPQLHDRVAYVLNALIKRGDEDPKQPKAILICTHAAAIIAMGRALTGRMPDEVGEEDFKCFTCGVSEFRRRKGAAIKPGQGQKWDPARPSDVPDVRWRDGNGVAGGWDCLRNSDCSFLDGGEERGWTFVMETQRIQKLEAEKRASAKTPESTAGFIVNR